MMKLKMLLAFVLVAGFGCVAEVSARQVQRRVGKPVPTGYKARLERIQSSGGFNARRGVRGGEFVSREGMHPQELELMMLQGQELNEDQQAQLAAFHAANPGIAEQFNEAMIAEGFEVAEVAMPTTEAVETATETIKTEENSSENKPLLPQEDQAEKLLAEGKETEEELVAQRDALKGTEVAPEVVAALDKQIEEQKTYRQRLQNAMSNAAGRAKAIAQYTAATAKSYATVKGIGTIIVGSALAYTGVKMYQQKGFIAGLLALKNEAAAAVACTTATMCTAAGKFTSLFSRKGADAIVAKAGATVVAEDIAANAPDLAAQLTQYSSIVRGEELSANLTALNEAAQASLEAFAESGESYVDVLARMNAEKAAEASKTFYETMNKKVNEYLHALYAGVEELPMQ